MNMKGGKGGGGNLDGQRLTPEKEGGGEKKGWYNKRRKR